MKSQLDQLIIKAKEDPSFLPKVIKAATSNLDYECTILNMTVPEMVNEYVKGNQKCDKAMKWFRSANKAITLHTIVKGNGKST